MNLFYFLDTLNPFSFFYYPLFFSFSFFDLGRRPVPPPPPPRPLPLFPYLFFPSRFTAGPPVSFSFVFPSAADWWTPLVGVSFYPESGSDLSSTELLRLGLQARMPRLTRPLAVPFFSRQPAPALWFLKRHLSVRVEKKIQSVGLAYPIATMVSALDR
jgi:hypothetical protein